MINLLHRQLPRRYLAVLGSLALAATLTPSPKARAERPPASQLLPENTVLVLSVPNAPDLVKRLKNTAMGRMIEDPQLKPLVKDLYGSVTDAVAALKDQIGLSLPELLAIPQGEVTLAVVAPDRGSPAVVLLLDAGDQLSNARKALARGAQELEKQPNVKKKESDAAGTKVTIYEGLGPRHRTAAYFEKDATLVLGSDVNVLLGILAAWNGSEEKRLADNEKFTAIIRRSRGTKDQTAQFFWFFDPVRLMKNIGQEDTQIRIAVATLPALGLDGVLGMGGSMIFDVGEFDDIGHFHLLLDNPRDGVVEMLALGSGDVKPEAWAPSDVVGYTTLHWRFPTTFKNLAELFDSFRGQGAFSQMLKRRVLDPTGVDVEKDILPALEGRVTHFNWIDRSQPITPQSNATLVGLRLKETEPVVKSLEKLAKKYETVIQRRTYASIEYYQIVPPGRADRVPDPNRPQPPQPCFGVLGDYLLATDRASAYEKVIVTSRGSGESLADALDFKLVAAKIARLSGGTRPAMISFNRPEEGMRFLYDLATAEWTRQRLAKGAEKSDFFRSVQTALQKNPLPPFGVLEQYLAPGGALVIDDDTGIHYTAFTLRRKKE